HSTRPPRTPTPSATPAAVDVETPVADAQVVEPAPPVPRAVLRIELEGLDPAVPQGNTLVTISRDGDRRRHAAVWASTRVAKEPQITLLRVKMRPAGWAKGVVQDDRYARVAGADVGAFT